MSIVRQVRSEMPDGMTFDNNESDQFDILVKEEDAEKEERGKNGTRDGGDERRSRESYVKLEGNGNVTDGGSNHFSSKDQENDDEEDGAIYVDSPKGNIKCKVCEKIFPYRSAFERHYVRHSGVKQFKCDICQGKFTLKSSLTRHQSLQNCGFHITLETRGEIKCQFCLKPFIAPGALKRHMLSHTSDGLFKCIHCDMSFELEGSLTKHLLLGCPEDINENANAFVHNQNPLVDPKSTPAITKKGDTISKQSPPSNKSSKQEKILDDSKSSDDENTLKKKPYICDGCGKGFLTRSECARHYVSHTGEKAFGCNLCQKAFAQKSNLKRHVISVHKTDPTENIVLIPKLEPDPYFDGTGFIGLQDIQEKYSDHNELDSNERKSDSEDDLPLQPRKSSQDTSEFADESELKEPNNVSDEGEPPKSSKEFDCQECGEEFSKLSALKKHLQCSKCKHCKKYFASKCILLKHKIAVHDEDDIKLSALQQQVKTIKQEEPEAPTEPEHIEMIMHVEEDITPEDDYDDNEDNEEMVLEDGELAIEEEEVIEPKPKKDKTKSIKKKYKCEECGKGFKFKSAYLKHDLDHSKTEEGYLCKHCDKLFFTEIAFKRHLYQTKKRYKCNECGKVFAQNFALRRHMMWHNGEKNIKCEKCDKKFYVESEYKRHFASHHEGQPRPTCDRCGKTFIYAFNLTRHMRFVCGKMKERRVMKKHGPANRPRSAPLSLLCFICGKVFNRRNNLVEHLRKHDGKRYKCETCGALFVTMANLRGHVNTFHSVDGPKKIMCPKCGKMLSKKSALKLHMMNHYGIRPHQCSVCDKSFVRKTHLETHMHHHTGVKPFRCHICDRTFTVAASHKRHVLAHCTDPNSFTCTICGKGFKFESYLRKHITVTHGPQDKKHMCNHCGRMFRFKGALTSHVRTHTGERPYSCKTCSKRFGSSSALRNHYQTHTDLKPFECSCCGKAFKGKCDLQKHMKIHQGKNYKCDFCDKCFSRKDNLNTHRMSHTKEKKGYLKSENVFSAPAVQND